MRITTDIQPGGKVVGCDWTFEAVERYKGQNNITVIGVLEDKRGMVEYNIYFYFNIIDTHTL